jgi:hypothetical protein
MLDSYLKLLENDATELPVDLDLESSYVLERWQGITLNDIFKSYLFFDQYRYEVHSTNASHYNDFMRDYFKDAWMTAQKDLQKNNDIFSQAGIVFDKPLLEQCKQACINRHSKPKQYQAFKKFITINVANINNLEGDLIEGYALWELIHPPAGSFNLVAAGALHQKFLKEYLQQCGFKEMYFTGFKDGANTWHKEFSFVNDNNQEQNIVMTNLDPAFFSYMFNTKEVLEKEHAQRKTMFVSLGESDDEDEDDSDDKITESDSDAAMQPYSDHQSSDGSGTEDQMLA